MSFNVEIAENKIYAVCDSDAFENNDLFKACLNNNCGGSIQDDGSHEDPLSKEILQGRVVKQNKVDGHYCYNDQKEGHVGDVGKTHIGRIVSGSWIRKKIP